MYFYVCVCVCVHNIQNNSQMLRHVALKNAAAAASDAAAAAAIGKQVKVVNSKWGKVGARWGGGQTVYNWEQLHNMPGAHFVSTAPRKLPKGQRAAATKCEGNSRGRGCVCV